MNMQSKKFYIELIAAILVGVAYIITVYFTITRKTENTRVNLFLLWEPQAQFLGNYTAEDLGFFQDEGIDIHIRHDLGVGNSMREILKEDENNYVVTQFINVLAWLGREPNIELVSIINRGCNLGWAIGAAKEDVLKVLQNGSIYSWWGSEDILLRFILLKNNNDISNLASRVTTKFPSKVTENSVALVMDYNELQDFPSTSEQKVNNISYCEMGYPIFEDVLLGKVATDPKLLDLHRRMIRAIWKGWDWAVKYRREAIDLLMRKNPRLIRERQEIQLEQFASTLVQKIDTIDSFKTHMNVIHELIEYDLIENSVYVRELIDKVYKSESLRFIVNERNASAN